MKKLFFVLAVLTVTFALQSTAQITTTKTQTNVAYSGTLPSATFAGLKNGDITVAKISSTDSLGTTNPSFRIVSFSLKANSANIPSNSSKINGDMKSVLTKLAVGDVFTFDNIKARYKTTGSIHNLSSMTFKLK
jgi:hypothetical protein